MAGSAPVSAARGLVHVSGVVPSRGTLDDPIERQVADVPDRLDRTLHEAGSSLARARP